MNYKSFLSISLLVFAGYGNAALAANLFEVEPNDVHDDDNTFVLLDNEFGHGNVSAGDDDFWGQIKVAVGDLIFAATSSDGDTELSIIEQDGTTISENPGNIDEAEDGIDMNSGDGDASAVSGLEATAPGEVYFRVGNGAGSPDYKLCTVVAKPTEVALESETIAGANDLTANATKYSKPVMFGILEEVDTYSFKARAGSYVMVIADNDPNGNGNVRSYIEILGTDATFLGDSQTSQADANATEAVKITKTGTYYVRFTNEGGPSDDYSFVICGAALSLEDDEEDEDLVKGTLGDFIWFDRNRDGIQDDNEPGVAGQRLNLLADDKITVLNNARSNSKGNYKFSGLDNGSYFVEWLKPKGALVTLQNTTDEDLDSDADPVTAITDHGTVSNFVGNDDLDIGLYPDIDPANVCPMAAPGAGNDSAKKVGFGQKSSKTLKFGGKLATISASDITAPEYVSVCVYYSGMLASEHYVGIDDPGFKLLPGKLIYKGKGTNVTGLSKLTIIAGAGKAKYKLKIKGLGEAPPPGVTGVIVYLKTDQLEIREEFSLGQLIQSGLNVKAKKIEP